MKLRILVTGGSGFIGQNLIRYLCETNKYEIIAPTRKSIPFQHANVHWIISELNDLRQHLSDLSFDVVYHLASFIPKNTNQANAFWENINSNIVAIIDLLRFIENRAKKIIYTSTIDVYGNGAPPIHEQSTCNPATLYGKTKLMAEEILRANTTANKLHHSILRLGHVYGPGEEKYEKFIPVLIKNTLQKIPTTITGDGSVQRDFIYVDDVCKILEKFIYIDHAGPVNIVSGTSYSLKQIIEVINTISHNQVQVIYSHSQNPTRSISFDNTLLRNLLGSDFDFVPIKNGLQSEFDYMKKIMSIP